MQAGRRDCIALVQTGGYLGGQVYPHAIDSPRRGGIPIGDLHSCRTEALDPDSIGKVCRLPR